MLKILRVVGVGWVNHDAYWKFGQLVCANTHTCDVGNNGMSFANVLVTDNIVFV